MKNYKFTQDWFDPKEFNLVLPKEINEEFHILEIGSFEGKSTIWFLENILKNSRSTITCVDPWTKYNQDNDSFNSYTKDHTEWDFTETKNLFLHNINQSGYEHKVKINQGLSHNILPKLIIENKKYDFIFIDGNHTSPFVLTDTIMSWYLLKKDGILMFDDYLWGNITSTDSPKLAIDSFVKCFEDYLNIIHSDYRFAIKKIK